MSGTRKQATTTKVQTRLWDAADYLEHPEDVVAYLDAALEDGDPQLIVAALGDIARSKGMTRVAADAGLGRESLYKALSSDGNPRFATVLKVLKATGIRLYPSVTPRAHLPRTDTNEFWGRGFTPSPDGPFVFVAGSGAYAAAPVSGHR